MSLYSPNAKPGIMFGMLFKYSPSPLSLQPKKKRFVILQDGVMYWSASASCPPFGSAGPPKCKGRLSFCENPFCEVATDPTSMTRFALRPANGIWSKKGGVTGARFGRIFVFGALTDSPSRADWLAALCDHMTYGEKQFSLRTMEPGPQDQISSLFATQPVVVDQETEVSATLSEMSKKTIDIMRQHGFSVEHIVKAHGPGKQQQVRDYVQPKV